MKKFTLTSPTGTKGFTGKTYREILSCELGEDTSARVHEIHLCSGGVTRWRVSGFDSSIVLPASPKNHTLELGVYDEWDGKIKIEASGGADYRNKIYPYAEMRGVVA